MHDKEPSNISTFRCSIASFDDFNQNCLRNLAKAQQCIPPLSHACACEPDPECKISVTK